MGHKEDLLAGARRCLAEKGYARTTARDIVAVSGTNLGSIGYHYGSVEALLNAAMFQAIEEWGDELRRRLLAAGTEKGIDYRVMFDQLIASFADHRSLWLASIEAFLQAEHSPELRKQMAEGQQEGRRGLAAMLTGTEEKSLPEETVRSIGSVQMALFSGIMVQWLTDPKHAPSSEEIIRGLRAIASLLPPETEKPAPKRGRAATKR